MRGTNAETDKQAQEMSHATPGGRFSIVVVILMKDTVGGRTSVR